LLFVQSDIYEITSFPEEAFSRCPARAPFRRGRYCFSPILSSASAYSK